MGPTLPPRIIAYDCASTCLSSYSEFARKFWFYSVICEPFGFLCADLRLGFELSEFIFGQLIEFGMFYSV